MRRSGYHVLLSVPTRGQIQWQTVTRLEEARDATPGLRPILYQPGNLSVAMTRNRVVRRFLETDCTTLVMVDDDVVPPMDFIGLLDRHVGEYGLVAIPHPMPVPADPGLVALGAFLRVTAGYAGASLDLGMNEVDAVATGCVAVSREALEALGDAPFRIEHDPSADVTSDDFLFCSDLQEAGFRIGCWWDGRPCDHVSSVSLGPILESQSAAMAGRR
jgi:hypothetical protein